MRRVWTREELLARARLVGDCWEWQMSRYPSGYGASCMNGKQIKAHRLAYTVLVGPIPEGGLVLHTCDNKPCVNPAHLYVGTATDNNRDTVKRNRRAPPRQVCKNGHEFTPENTMRAWKSAGVVSGRRCRICTYRLNRESRERAARLRQEAQP